jgi:hypothetical protein
MSDQDIPQVYETRDIIGLLQVEPNFLNKLVERRLYGIKPSIKAGRNRGSRRWFSRADVLGIAFVWWLFQAGVRAGAGRARESIVQAVIDEVCGKPGSTANKAAKLISDLTKMLVIVRQPHVPKPSRESQRVELINNEHELSNLLKKYPYAFCLIVPFGSLFADLREQIASRTWEE